MPLQELAQQLFKQYYLTIKTLSMLCCFPLFNALCIWEILQNVKPLCKHAHKWHMGSEVVLEFWLYKNQHKKHLSSSTLSTIYTKANSTNFTFKETITNVQDVMTKHHNMVKELISKCGAMHIVAFNFIVDLNMPYLAIKITNIQNLRHKGLHPIHQLDFIK